MAEATFPHVVCPGPCEEQPTGLDRQGLHQFGALQAAEKDRNWAKQFVVERQPFHHGLDRRRHDVDWKQVQREDIRVALLAGMRECAGRNLECYRQPARRR